MPLYLCHPESVNYRYYLSWFDKMSVVSQVILKADDELRYPSSGELQGIGEFLQTGERRMRIAATLAENEKKIVAEASKQLWQKRPDFISPGGNAYGQKERAQCLRDYGWYLRLVTYGILAGDKEPIEKIGIVGVKEMYNSLGVPVAGMVESIRCLKNASLQLLSAEDGIEASPYFDYIIQSMS
jgi:allophycocyanin-B